MKSLVKTSIKNAEEIVSCFFVSITVCLVIVNVILRYIFNIGLYWSEEVATICFVWSVFIGAAACYKRKMHIGIDFLIKLVPEKIQDLINLVVHSLLIIINGYIAYLSIIFIRASYIKPTAVLGISSAYVSSSLLVGFGLMTMYSIIFFMRDLKNFLNSFKEVQDIKSI
ncbi:TRAP transporter small permease [Natronincola ferrireducens]|uniref:TRAP-type C4-dicarboxylate transport system, small permease component n=1 Tax=Natronincola ferrireducens TaxID=393762 RepID=A0A1G8YI38_9FIRM|nr:TRAP transporter small permease [Natronincola ferrireducens]SDK01845.1 TRAP-type C4-dicarboxylate transport system, small permease component [Natronincola ferrireducens]